MKERCDRRSRNSFFVLAVTLAAVQNLFCGASTAFSQGTFLIDQQSAPENPATESGPSNIQTQQPLGQSFTPSLSAIGVIRLWLVDQSGGNNMGATVYVNLLSGSISGTILGASQLVTMPDSFGLGPNAGYVDFLFSTPITVTPGTTYYFQPVVQSGDFWGVSGSLFYNYPGGMQFSRGVGNTSADLWFQEGIIVLEPSTWALLILGGGALFFRWRKVA